MPRNNPFKDVPDDVLEQEWNRRQRSKHRKAKREQEARVAAREAELGDPSPESLMKLRLSEEHQPYFRKFRQWYRENWEYKHGLGSGGSYWTQTQQLALSLMIRREQPLDDQLGILEFLPYIEEQHVDLTDTSVRAKLVDIFENSLSAHGVYKLVVEDAEHVYIRLLVHGRVRRHWHFGSVREALEHIQRELFYGD